MKVLLLYDVEGLGQQGETVSVRDGYARNYLLPRRLACLPHPGAARQLELRRRKQQKIEKELRSRAEEAKAALEALGEIEIEARANEEGVLFGSVTPGMIADALRARGVRIDGRQVELESPVRSLGTFEVTIRLHRDIRVPVRIRVSATRQVAPGGAGEPPRAGS